MATRDELVPVLSQSLPNYSAIGGYGGVQQKTPPTIYCIHGNKFGVALCCDSLTDNSPDDIRGDGEDGTLDADTADVRLLDPHCHGRATAAELVDKKARRRLIVASVLCLVFMVIEIVGGVWAGSLAIATDAAHLLTDFASFLISLFSLWVASRPATTNMSFGWHRAEVIGATVSVLMIWVVTGILLYMAVLRVTSMDFELEPTVMLITSGIGVGVNVIMGCSLHQSGHGHGHGTAATSSHSHDQELGIATPQERTNVNVKAAFIHVIGDFVQSIGVLIAATIIYIKPEWKIADPICTFIFSVLVLLTTIRILSDTVNVLMEGIPRDVSFNVVREMLMSVEGIVAVHDLRIWGLTTDKTALSAHLVVDGNIDEQQILKRASALVRAKYNIYEMTLQVERFQSEMDNCGKCQPPEN